MDPETARRMQATYDTELKAFKSIQTKIAELIPIRQKLLTQLNENTMVQTEMTDLDDEATVYKLSGPILVKQDISEAKDNISNRIKYFKAEIERTDAQEQELMKQRGEQSKKLENLQNSARAIVQAAVQAQTKQQEQSGARKQQAVGA